MQKKKREEEKGEGKGRENVKEEENDKKKKENDAPTWGNNIHIKADRAWQRILDTEEQS